MNALTAGVTLTVAGLIALCFNVPHAGWALAVGLFAVWTSI